MTTLAEKTKSELITEIKRLQGVVSKLQDYIREDELVQRMDPLDKAEDRSID